MGEDQVPTDAKPTATRTPLPIRRNQSIISALLVDVSPIDMRLLGRTIMHAMLVGIGAGMIEAFHHHGDPSVAPNSGRAGCG